MTDDGSQSHLSRLADQMEEVQLRAGDILLGHAADMLKDDNVKPWELRYLSARPYEALGDALRVAESRGDRLTSPTVDDDASGAPDDGPAPAEGASA